jgi:lysyl-tRNA synthetase class 2
MWYPNANLSVLRQRARLYHDIRHFFAKRSVLEVETPILSAATLPEAMIELFYTHYQGNETQRLFLQPSPEAFMKRLLAAGSGAIYQIARVFRDGEVGRWHNPEFSLLEWYRPGFTQMGLISEVIQLLQHVLGCQAAEYFSYCELFESYTDLHPLRTELSKLQKYATRFNIHNPQTLDRDACLQLIMLAHIEPQLGHVMPTVVFNFPASQAALARKHPDNSALAERFEVYVQGLELANGFRELTDPIEQRQRFEQELAKRQVLKKPLYPLDERFLTALHSGLPDCAGVAVGLDRLLALKVGALHIQDVLTFAFDRA